VAAVVVVVVVAVVVVVVVVLFVLVRVLGADHRAVHVEVVDDRNAGLILEQL